MTGCGVLPSTAVKKKSTTKKPSIEASAAKAVAVVAARPDLAASRMAVSVLDDPWQDVSEEELVAVVKAWYAIGPKVTRAQRQNVMAQAIRPRYGDFPFAKFGFGTFVEFSRRNGISVNDGLLS